ncbi:MAG: hypothetical protein M3Q14_04365 [bacterium]|nr:hypothetical protein [bacterium]
MTTKINRLKGSRLFAVALLLLVAILSTNVLHIYAAGLSSTSVRFNRMKAATATTLRVTFTVPAGNTGTEANLKLSFPDSYTVATAGLTASGVGCGATQLPGTLAVTGNNTNGSKALTVTGVTNLSASTTYCVDIDRTATNDPLTNPAAGQYSVTVETQDSSNVRIDHTVIGARVVGDDQVVVSAVVPPTFNFVLDANTTSFTTNLDVGSVVQTTARTVTITSNATQGWIAWARDTNTGLTSASAAYTISATTPGTGATLAAGTEGYVIGVEGTDAGGGGVLTVVPAYAGTAANNNGSGFDTGFRQVASANGTANGDVITLRGKAAIGGVTPAGADYTDTWTIIGAGSF